MVGLLLYVTGVLEEMDATEFVTGVSDNFLRSVGDGVVAIEPDPTNAG